MSVTVELQDALVAHLQADPALLPLIGGRVYDNVPAAPVYPYVSLGPTDGRPEALQCLDTREITCQFDVWTHEQGQLRSCRLITDALARALRDAEIALVVNACVRLEVELIRVLRDPDGVTGHGIVQVTADTEVA